MPRTIFSTAAYIKGRKRHFLGHKFHWSSLFILNDTVWPERSYQGTGEKIYLVQLAAIGIRCRRQRAEFTP